MTKQVNHKELEKLIKIAYKSKVPLFVWGTTGIGKSQTIRKVSQDLAKETGLEFSENEIEDGKFGFVDVRISQFEPSDLRGLPDIQEDKTKWKPPDWLPRNPKGKGIIFFDELNLAPPSIQASAYQLILDRKLGDYKLPDGWVIISAGNRLEDRANVFELPAPLSNRFAHIELRIPSVEEWTEWALNHNIDSRIIAYLQFKQSHLFQFKENSKERAFPTPRSWEFCSKLIIDIPTSDIETLEMLVASAVGEGVALEFSAFLKLQKKVDLDEIIKNPKEIENYRELDMRYSIISGISEKYSHNKKIIKNIVEICDYLEPEFAILLLRLTKGKDVDYFKREIIKVKNWRAIADKYGKYLI